MTSDSMTAVWNLQEKSFSNKAKSYNFLYPYLSLRGGIASYFLPDIERIRNRKTTNPPNFQGKCSEKVGRKIHQSANNFWQATPGAYSYRVKKLPARPVGYSRIENSLTSGYFNLRKHGACAGKEYRPLTKLLGNRLFGEQLFS